MTFLSRLLGTQRDPREKWRPLWHRLVGAAREEHWYAKRGAADTLDGRFDMISMLTALFILRLESEPGGPQAAARLTELQRRAGIGVDQRFFDAADLRPVLGGEQPDGPHI